MHFVSRDINLLAICWNRGPYRWVKIVRKRIGRPLSTVGRLDQRWLCFRINDMIAKTNYYLRLRGPLRCCHMFHRPHYRSCNHCGIILRSNHSFISHAPRGFRTPTPIPFHFDTVFFLHFVNLLRAEEFSQFGELLLQFHGVGFYVLVVPSLDHLRYFLPFPPTMNVQRSEEIDDFFVLPNLIIRRLILRTIHGFLRPKLFFNDNVGDIGVTQEWQ
mmetsp:Transcript_4987/g.8923  ORF Transcript_4987/g.8923 Transcript_4987/m.8923 type:complete len:216 (-) Transcript_4987:1123-1770(-)